MNLYQVQSEELISYYYIGLPEKVPESYCIFELIAADIFSKIYSKKY